MKSIVPVVMAGILGIYGLIIAVVISTGINQTAAKPFYLYDGYAGLGAGLVSPPVRVTPRPCRHRSRRAGERGRPPRRTSLAHPHTPPGSRRTAPHPRRPPPGPRL